MLIKRINSCAYPFRHVSTFLAIMLISYFFLASSLHSLAFLFLKLSSSINSLILLYKQKTTNKKKNPPPPPPPPPHPNPKKTPPIPPPSNNIPDKGSCQ